MKNFIVTFTLLTILACQNNQKTILTKKFDLPKKLKEVSGMTYVLENQSIWCLEDSGNKNELYQIDSIGILKNTITIDNTENIDWEDITKDNQGNLYIGDFGNNDNDRKDLCIYKINVSDLNNDTAVPAYKITFQYTEQTDFPPKKKNLVYDVEGFFELNDYFYLITKNRSKNFDGSAMVYKIPNSAGNRQAILVTTINTGTDFKNGAITSAAITPDAKTVVLLTHSKIIMFKNFENDAFWKGTKTEIDLQHYSQKEAICFKNDHVVYISDEKIKKAGGDVFELEMK